MVDVNNIKNVAIIGAGVLGHSIAQVALMAGFEKITLVDLNMDLLNSAGEKIEGYLTRLNSEEQFKQMLETFDSLKTLFTGKNLTNALKDPIRFGQLAEGVSVEELMKRLIKEVNLKKAVADADYVIEAVSEVMEVKQEMFKKLVEYTPSHVVLATNSSSLSITKIAEHSGSPERIIGMHFFNAVISPLIEITRGEKSSNESIEIGGAIGQKLPCLIGKRTIIKLEKESPGFIANRIMSASGIYLTWATDRAVEKGIPLEGLNADVGILTAGIFAMQDSIGLNVIYDVSKYLEATLSPDFAPGKVLSKLVDEGNWGMKSGKGYYEWNDNGTLKTEVKKAQPAGLLKPEAFIAIQLNEGCRILEEGVVKGYRTIDKAIIKGYLSPGPFATGKRNYEEYCNLLEELSEQTGIQYFKPCNLMKSGDFLTRR